MAHNAADFIRAFVEIVDDKKARTELKKHIKVYAETKTSAMQAVEELREVEEDLRDMHGSITAVELAKEMETKAEHTLKDARKQAQDLLPKARDNVKDMYEEHDAWYADIQAKEITIHTREAELAQKLETSNTTLHKREVLIRQQETATVKREALAEGLVKEYTAMLKTLRQNVSELNG